MISRNHSQIQYQSKYCFLQSKFEAGLIRVLDQLLREMERRLLAQSALVEHKVEDLKVAFEGFISCIEERDRYPSTAEQVSDASHHSSEAGTTFAREDNVGTQLLTIDRRLCEIASAVGAKSAAGAVDKEEDCKRLKEKLKGALELERALQPKLPGDQYRVTWVEYVFGICKPDGRLGKRGSRWNLPA